MDWIYLYQGSAIILYQTEGGQEVNLLCGGRCHTVVLDVCLPAILVAQWGLMRGYIRHYTKKGKGIKTTWPIMALQ